MAHLLNFKRVLDWLE